MLADAVAIGSSESTFSIPKTELGHHLKVHTYIQLLKAILQTSEKNLGKDAATAVDTSRHTCTK